MDLSSTIGYVAWDAVNCIINGNTSTGAIAEWLAQCSTGVGTTPSAFRSSHIPNVGPAACPVGGCPPPPVGQPPGSGCPPGVGIDLFAGTGNDSANPFLIDNDGPHLDASLSSAVESGELPLLWDPVFATGQPGFTSDIDSEERLRGTQVDRGSDETAVTLAFTRGDANSDGSVKLADTVFILGFLFPTGPPNEFLCEDAADTNDDGTLNISDSVTLLNALFGTPPIPLPPPALCGVDPTIDPLDVCSGPCP